MSGPDGYLAPFLPEDRLLQYSPVRGTFGSGQLSTETAVHGAPSQTSTSSWFQRKANFWFRLAASARGSSWGSKPARGGWFTVGGAAAPLSQ